VHKDSQATWETQMSPAHIWGIREALTQSLPARGRRAQPPQGANDDAHAGIAKPKENEAEREGHRRVGVPNTTEEAGEPTRGTLWRKGGTGLMNC
jgi:hypothetical protein